MFSNKINTFTCLSVFGFYSSIFDLKWVTVANARLSATSNLYKLPSRKDANANTNQIVMEDGSNESFDFFVLAMSFQPEFCYSHSKKQMNDETRNDLDIYERHSKNVVEYPGCMHPIETWKHNLTIHGLWPQYADGTWPSTCSFEEFDEDIMEEFGWNVIESMWPNVKATLPSSVSTVSNLDDYSSFWKHEWSKHGTCSGLSQRDYFGSALKQFIPTPSIVYEHYRRSTQTNQPSPYFSKKQFLDAYGELGQVVPVCSHGKYLSEIRICLDKDNETNFPNGRIPCPASVRNEDNCDDIIHITVFAEDMSDQSGDYSMSFVEDGYVHDQIM